jgi:argininosuccinate lyase
MSDLLRNGRLKSSREDAVEFTSSLKDDKIIFKNILNINKAHIIMLAEQGIINSKIAKNILDALENINKKKEIETYAEDAHMIIEEKVIKAVGILGGNLNIGKSRNDQVSTAIRMNLREEIIKLMETIIKLQESLTEKAQITLTTIIPAYTHLQPAQPITLAHYLIAQFDSLQRSLNRLEEAYSRVNLCPMGAAALATTSFSINRDRIAKILGFKNIIENSLDAVSTRDFLLEIQAILSIIAVDISRLAEDLIIWNTREFNIIELPDEFAFTSSIMPQKKNPDILEVIRARMSLILGDFVSSAIVMKSLPSAYNLDFQEITQKLWSSLNKAQKSLNMLSKLIPELEVKNIFLDKIDKKFLTSTELANMLTRKYKVPFRIAHKVVGSLTKILIEDEKSLKDLTPELLEKILKNFLKFDFKLTQKDIHEAIELSSFIKSHKVKGGPSQIEVARTIISRKKKIQMSKKDISKKRAILEDIEVNLKDKIKGLN